MARDAELLAAQGQRIRDLRTQARKSQEKVAYEVGVSARRYRDWEAGRGGLSHDKLRSLAGYFGTTEDFIEYGRIKGDTPDPFQGVDRLTALEQAVRELQDQIRALQAQTAANVVEVLRRIDAIAQPTAQTRPPQRQGRRDAPAR